MDITRIDPEETKKRLDAGDGTVYVDVRTAGEYGQGHVPGAVNIAAFNPSPAGMAPNPQFVSQVEARFRKDDKIIVGCQRGGRSMQAARLLIDAGFSRIVDMRGGYDGEMDGGGAISFPGWSRRGLPIEK